MNKLGWIATKCSVLIVCAITIYYNGYNAGYDKSNDEFTVKIAELNSINAAKQRDQIEQYKTQYDEMQVEITKYWQEKHKSDLANFKQEKEIVYVTKEIKVEADEINTGECDTVSDDVVRLLKQSQSIIDKRASIAATVITVITTD